MPFTPGPWKVCNDLRCKCAGVWSEHHPVAQVISGKWGDEFPSLRLVGDSIGRQAEAYTEMIEYGEIDQETADANTRLIAAAPTMLDALRQSDRLEDLPRFLLLNGHPAIASIVDEVLDAQHAALKAAGVEGAD